jgi:hypothetical protein
MRTIAATLLVFAAVLPIAAAPASAQTIGVVLMLGNTDSPQGLVYSLATALRGLATWSTRLRCAGRDGASMTDRFSTV